ncbi:MAG: hypothetical protein AAFX50_15880, partial [Acidobacteriota bacterium]
AIGDMLDLIGSNGAMTEAARQADAALLPWIDRLQNLKPEDFKLVRTETCDYPYFNTRETTLTLVQVDRTAGKDAEPRTVPLVTIVCRAILSTSLGFSVGSVDEREFDFVQAPGDDGGVKRVIGIDSEGGEDVLALALVHARFGVGKTGRDAWALSAGTQFNFSDTDGDRLGYVFGVSYGIGHTFYITVGAEARRLVELEGGFEVGDDAPTELATIPTTKEWDVGAFIGFTVGLN